MIIIKKNIKLDNSESRLTYLINQLKNKLHNEFSLCNSGDQDENEDLNRTYNRLLIERAIIRKKLEQKKSKNVLINFCEKLNKKHNKKFICDYFTN